MISLINYDSRARENSEVVIKFTQIDVGKPTVFLSENDLQILSTSNWLGIEKWDNSGPLRSLTTGELMTHVFFPIIGIYLNKVPSIFSHDIVMFPVLL